MTWANWPIAVLVSVHTDKGSERPCEGQARSIGTRQSSPNPRGGERMDSVLDCLDPATIG